MSGLLFENNKCTIAKVREKLSWPENAYLRPRLGVSGILTSKVGQIDLVLGLLVSLCTQDYKSLCAAVQTDAHTHSIVISL